MPKPCLAVIEQHIKEQPNIAVTYFLPDDKKIGGRYVTVSGNVRKPDGLERVIMMVDGLSHKKFGVKKFGSTPKVVEMVL